MIYRSLIPRVFLLRQEIDTRGFGGSSIQPYSVDLDDSAVKCYRNSQLVGREPYTSVRKDSIDEQTGAKSGSLAGHIIEEKLFVQDKEPLMLMLEVKLQ